MYLHLSPELSRGGITDDSMWNKILFTNLNTNQDKI